MINIFFQMKSELDYFYEMRALCKSGLCHISAKKSCDFRAPENNKNVESRYFSYFSMKVGTFYLEKEEKNKMKK